MRVVAGGDVSKRIDAPYTPGNRGLWVKTKCLNREEFVVAGWTDPEGSRPFLGALLLAYYTPNGRLVYAGRVGGGISNAELERLWHLLQPLAAPDMPLDVPPPRTSRFGSPLVLSRVHWVRPELVVEVKYLAWTVDNLLRQVTDMRDGYGNLGRCRSGWHRRRHGEFSRGAIHSLRPGRGSISRTDDPVAGMETVSLALKVANPSP